MSSTEKEKSTDNRNEKSIPSKQILVPNAAPDGGYGWVIVFASFMLNLIGDGIAYTFGLFFEILLQHFDTSKSKVALCGALLIAFCLGAGPIVSSLINKCGCRLVAILGSIITCVALILSSIAPNIEILMLTYGVLGGIGLGFIYLPSMVSVGHYFTTKRAFATGIAVCGSGVGTFLMAPFCQYLLSVTSWQNTFVLLGFIALSSAVFGALMAPLGTHLVEVSLDSEDQTQNQSKPTMERQISKLSLSFHGSLFTDSNLTITCQSRRPTICSQNSEFTARKSSLIDQQIQMKILCSKNNQSLQKVNKSIQVRALSKKDIFYSGSTKHLTSQNSQRSLSRQSQTLASAEQNLVSIPTRDIIENIEKQVQSGENQDTINRNGYFKNVFVKVIQSVCPVDDSKKSTSLKPRSLCSILSEMFDLSLFRESIAFTILAISNIFGTMGFYVPFVYVTQFVTSSVQGVSSENAALLISAIGITNTLGRLLFGYLGDRLVQKQAKLFGFDMTVLTLHNFCILFAGLSIVVTPFCATYSLILLDCVAFGLFVAGYICLTSIILVEMLGLDKLTNSLGLICLFRGVSSLLGTPLAGVIFDATQSYLITFSIAGILLVIAAVMTFFITLPKKIDDDKQQSNAN